MLKIGKYIIVYDEKPRVCELCGKIEECRPYGPNYEQICFDCGMKDKEMTKKRFDEILDDLLLTL